MLNTFKRCPSISSLITGLLSVKCCSKSVQQTHKQNQPLELDEGQAIEVQALASACNWCVATRLAAAALLVS